MHKQNAPAALAIIVIMVSITYAMYEQITKNFVGFVYVNDVQHGII